MTIVDEDNAYDYYLILQYVEFLEFLVRVAIKSEFEGKHEEKLLMFIHEVYVMTKIDAKVIQPEYDD